MRGIPLHRCVVLGSCFQTTFATKYGTGESARTGERSNQRENNGTKTTTANQGQRGAKQRRSKQNYGSHSITHEQIDTIQKNTVQYNQSVNTARAKTVVVHAQRPSSHIVVVIRAQGVRGIPLHRCVVLGSCFQTISNFFALPPDSTQGA